MTPREQEVLDLIRDNPLMSQNDLARKLNITRASVGVHVSNLMRKGYLKGRGYILNEHHPITLIGGANVDVQAKPSGRLVLHDSNPGRIRHALGGVARNIAENLAMMGCGVRLVTAVGEDVHGERIIRNALSRGIDITDIIETRELPTSTYCYINDERGELLAAVSDMSILTRIDEDFLRARLARIDHSGYTLLDANLPESSLRYLCGALKETKIIADPVSAAKAYKLMPHLDRFELFKPNRLEAQTLLGRTLDDQASIREAGRSFLERGVRRIVISLGQEGIYYADANDSFFLKPRTTRMVNVNGAGDAFLAGLIHGLDYGMRTRDMLAFALSAAALTTECEETIHPDMSADAVRDLERRTRR